MNPSEKQLNYIASLMGVKDNRFHSSAYAEIFRMTGAKEKKATMQHASDTIAALKNLNSATLEATNGR